MVKKSSLKLRENAGVLLKIRNSEGMPFLVKGPTMEKAQICLVEVWAKLTMRRPCWDEWSN